MRGGSRYTLDLRGDRLGKNRRGKSDLKRIVSIFTRLIQRTETVSEDSIEYEFRDSEDEYEE